MSENNSLFNLGDWSKPADTLIKKISSAAGILYEPHHIPRVAKAEAKADLIRAKSEIEITDLQRRTARRWFEEETKQQKNMEDITTKALPNLNEDANPDSMDDDWITNFFDKCRIVSDDEMQVLWSRVLAGEANTPNTYSKRTVNFLSDLDKSEADLFAKLCDFIWMAGDLKPLVFDEKAGIYNSHRINFTNLNHLDSIGLIQFAPSSGFAIFELPKRFSPSYHEKPLFLEMPKNKGNKLNVGTVLLTRTGKELAPICGSKPVEGFWEYVKEQWKEFLPKLESPE